MPKWWSVSDRESPALNRNVIIQVSGTSGGAKESRAGQWWREKRQVSRQLVYWWVAISSSQLSWTDICRFLSASILVVRLASKTTQLLLLREYDVQTTLFFPAGDTFLKSTRWLWMLCCLHIWGENDKRIDTCSSYKCVQLKPWWPLHQLISQSQFMTSEVFRGQDQKQVQQTTRSHAMEEDIDVASRIEVTLFDLCFNLIPVFRFTGT